MGVDNRQLPLTWPMAYTTDCSTVKAVKYISCVYRGNKRCVCRPSLYQIAYVNFSILSIKLIIFSLLYTTHNYRILPALLRTSSLERRTF